jgi:hypothetical protein
MITPISTLKRWFANFKKPTQEQFWAWLDSYWHKSEKIPMDTIDGLENAIRGTASADQLRNHLTDSQAHQELFATKVDKEAGKGLSSNDYTNAEKRTNQANAKKRIVNLTVTGDVDKIITLTFADGTALQAPFTDKDTLPENLADIKLNSLNFDHNTGVLTGLRSDGQQLTVSLDGRYALLGHTHPEYAYRTHTHSEYAPKEHRHNWDDIDGKPSISTSPRNYRMRGNIAITQEYDGAVIFLDDASTITISDQGVALYCVSFRKMTNLAVSFVADKKILRYTGEESFTGNAGSTAVVSVYYESVIIDIRNISKII